MKSITTYPMCVASLASQNSKHNGAHVGCVIASKSHHIISTGWNGNCPGIDDDAVENLQRDDRLVFSIHAEENALLNAAQFGTRVEGCDAYVTGFPCGGCISKLFKAGIDRIFYIPNEEFEARWKNPNLYIFGDRESSIIPMTITDDKPVKEVENDSLLTRIKSILASHLMVDIDLVHPNSDIHTDLGADSLDCVEILILIEEDFELEIDDHEVESVQTVDQILKLILKKQSSE